MIFRKGNIKKIHGKEGELEARCPCLLSIRLKCSALMKTTALIRYLTGYSKLHRITSLFVGKRDWTMPSLSYPLTSYFGDRQSAFSLFDYNFLTRLCTIFPWFLSLNVMILQFFYVVYVNIFILFLAEKYSSVHI